jgi:thiol-disulfide isomerase/thioredoxin
VVLVDFWTYTCINCIRTFPFLKVWHGKYRDDGLVIVGVHTPEFEFEKDYDNVVMATRDNGLSWPVAQDNDFVTWRNYDNQYWPAKYLIDKDGVIRYTHFGEGGYRETEEQIRTLLAEAGADLSDDASVFPEDQSLDPTYVETRNGEVTPELYAGYDRNNTALIYRGTPYVAQPAYFEAQDTVINLVAPTDLIPHTISFQGAWHIGKERARHGRTTEHHEDYIALQYSAKSVNAVLTSDLGEPYRVRVTRDGAYLNPADAGADIMIGADGESFLLVTEPRLYEVVNTPGYQRDRVLRLSSDSDNFGLFAFTFGVYQEGP